MTRMALRGLLARKLRTALTGFAVVIGVAFVAGTFIFTDTINASFDDLFKQVSKGVDVDVTANQPVEGDFGGRIQPLPPGTLEKVRAVSGVDAAEPRLETQVTIFEKNGEPISGNGPPSIVFSTNEPRFDPQTYVEGHRADAVGEVTLDKATADRYDYHVGDKLKIAGRAPAKDYDVVGISKLGDQKSLGIKSMSMPLQEVQRIAATPGQITEVAVAAADGTSPEQLKAGISRALGGTAEVRTGQEQADKSSADITDSLGLPDDRPARVRRDRGVRRQLPDLQHVRGHRRPALARVRAAPHARRVAAPGAQLGGRRDARDRLRRLGDRHPGRSRHRARAARPARVGRDRAAVDEHGDRAAHDHRRARRRHDRDARVGTRAGPARDPGGAGRGDARGGHAGCEEGQPQAARELERGDRARPGGAAARPVRRRRRVRRGVAARVRRRGDDLRRRAPRAGARAAAGPLHRRAARADTGHARPAGARERRAPAAADGDHRLRADDRARARGVHRDLRGRGQRVRRQGDRRPVQPHPR